MAHDPANFFETIVAPAALNNQLLPRYKNKLVDSIYMGYRQGQVGHIGMPTVLNLPVVNEADVNMIGSGPLVVSDKSENKVTLTIDQKQSIAKKIESFDQLRTPVDLQQQYLLGMIESLIRKVNRSVAGLITPTNFNAYNPATIVGGSDKAFTRVDVSAAWTNVVGIGAAPETPGDLFFYTDQSAYGQMIGDKTNDWISYLTVGESAAVAGQQRATLPNAFNARVDYDQMVTSVTPNRHAGAFFHRMAIGMAPVAENAPDATAIKHIVIPPGPGRPFPIMLQYGYSLEQQGYVLHVYTIYGLAIIKKEWCQYMETAAPASS